MIHLPPQGGKIALFGLCVFRSKARTMTVITDDSRGLQFRLTACYIAVFLAPGIGLPFWPTWLEFATSLRFADRLAAGGRAVGEAGGQSAVLPGRRPAGQCAADPDRGHRRQPRASTRRICRPQFLGHPRGGGVRHHVHHQHGAADRRHDDCSSATPAGCNMAGCGSGARSPSWAPAWRPAVSWKAARRTMCSISCSARWSWRCSPPSPCRARPGRRPIGCPAVGWR